MAGQQISAMQSQQSKQPHRYVLVVQGILKTTVGVPMIVFGSVLTMSSAVDIATTLKALAIRNQPISVDAAGSMILMLVAAPITGALGARTAAKGTKLMYSGYSDIKSGCKANQS